MVELLLLSFLTVLMNIVGSSYLLVRGLKGRLGSPLVEAIAVSVSAALVSWAIPLESAVGATLRLGWFKPWSVGWIIGFWVIIAVPTAILQHSKIRT